MSVHVVRHGGKTTELTFIRLYGIAENLRSVLLVGNNKRLDKQTLCGIYSGNAEFDNIGQSCDYFPSQNNQHNNVG